jgi:hypothetical protein
MDINIAPQARALEFGLGKMVYKYRYEIGLIMGCHGHLQAAVS